MHVTQEGPDALSRYGVATHKDLHVAAVIDESDRVLASQCFAAIPGEHLLVAVQIASSRIGPDQCFCYLRERIQGQTLLVQHLSQSVKCRHRLSLRNSSGLCETR